MRAVQAPMTYSMSRIPRLFALGAMLVSAQLAGCIEHEPFGWISAEWVDCERVASIWSDDGDGGFARRDVPCDTVSTDPESGPELLKACDFEVAKPASCDGGVDAAGDVGGDDGGATQDDGAGTEVLDDVADTGPEAEIAPDVAEVTEEVAIEVLDDVPTETVEETLDDVPEETLAEVLDDTDVDGEVDVADAMDADTAADIEVDAGPPDCAALAPECNTGVWDADAGECEFLPIAAACDDGDPCTENDTCSAGECVGGAKDCDDGIACTEDICVGAGTCQHVATACECQLASDCADAGLCNDAVCNEQLECVAAPISDGTTCSDSSVAGQCKSGACMGVQEISVGYYHACARLPLGEVKCWGTGSDGQLGTGGVYPVGMNHAVVAPTAVDLGEPAIAVSAGGFHSCAVLVSGAVRCWGLGTSGQLGAGNTEKLTDAPAEAPSTVDLQGDVAIAITAGADHTCVVTSLGKVRCWGNGGQGRLGSGATLPLMAQPGEHAATVVVQSAFSAVSAGNGHTCAIGGLTRCWGQGGQGQLGSASTDNILDGIGSAVPQAVQLGSAVTSLSVGGSHSCAVADGAVRCWGASYFGQTGSGAADALLDGQGTLDEASVVSAPTGSFLQVAAGTNHTCARTSEGVIHCWGYSQGGSLSDHLMDEPGEVPAIPIAAGATEVAAGLNESCATVGGQVLCWSNNQIPGPYVNLMGTDGSACAETADCLSGVCSGSICAGD